MRTAVRIIGVLLVISGVIWFLQGINVIPGSFMTGQMSWTIYGAITALLGVALIIGAKKRRKENSAG